MKRKVAKEDFPVKGSLQKFFADAMLGRLATWLRILGFDVAYERKIDDKELVERAQKEDRIILTRDTLLVKRRGARGRSFFVEGDRFEVQLRQVAERFAIDNKSVLTRCVRCNTLLERVEKESVRDLVPPYVYKTQEEFSRCPRCARIYWAGTHRERMLEKLSALINGKGAL
ncbi:MAG: Mut7-C RNAse domain-containing protein [Thermodesulfobacteriota bacterium]